MRRGPDPNTQTKRGDTLEPFYLIGEPLRIPYLQTEVSAPMGNFYQWQRVLQEANGDLTKVRQHLAVEYLAIVTTLQKMGVSFKIVYAHPKDLDETVLNACLRTLGCRGLDLTMFFHGATAYPRDFCTMVGDTFLFSPHAVQELRDKEKRGWKLRISPLGEGGRVLVQGTTMVCCERAILKDGQSTPVHEELRVLEREGFTVGTFPSPLNTRFTPGLGGMTTFSGDHIDRVACLLRSKDGALFLLLDFGAATADWTRPAKPFPWTVRPPAETLEYLTASLGNQNILVTLTPSLTVPYALNLVQFPNGKVLMTGGDPIIKLLVENIVGKGNVYETPIPIRYYPVFMQAGIRCLVSEAPMPILNL